MDMGRQWRATRRLGERERWWRGLSVGVAYGQRGEREARWGSLGEGEVDMGRQWRPCWRLGERERRERGPGARGGALGSRSGASGWLRHGGGVGTVSAGAGCAVRGGSGRAAVCGAGPRRSSRASQEVSAVPGGPRVAPPGTGGGGGGPPPSIYPPRRGAVAAAAGAMGRVTVPGGVGPRGPLWRGCAGRGDTVPGTGGVAPGGRWGMGVAHPVAAMSYAGAARAQEVVARWGCMVGSGSGGGGVGGGGGGAAGGGGACSGGDGAAGMALGPLVDIPVPV